MHPSLAIFLVMLGCCSNVVFLECMTRVLPGCGNLVTCCQFLFIALHGFFVTMRCGNEKSKIPVGEYVILVSMFFASSVLNNYSLNFGIPMPLHMIFKSGSLVANLLMGMVVLNRFYPWHKYGAVVLITVGIIISTIASQSVKNQAAAAGGAGAVAEDGLDRSSASTLAVGVVILIAALLLSARLGIFQEVLYKTHGKHAQQALFVTHALPLPGFLLLGSDILHHAGLFLQSAPLSLGGFTLPVPRLLFFLVCNVLTQYLCVSSVFRLTEECKTLTVTLVVTLRKFLSLLFSIWYFQNPFVAEHWLGCVLVFSGTFIFLDPFGAFAEKPHSNGASKS